MYTAKTHGYSPKLDVDDRVVINLGKMNIHIIQTAEGIIIDTYSKNYTLLNTTTIWNDDINKEGEDEDYDY